MKDDGAPPPGNREYRESGEEVSRHRPACFGNTAPRGKGVYPVLSDNNPELIQIRETGEAHIYGLAHFSDACVTLFEDDLLYEASVLEGGIEFTLADIIESLSVADLEKLLEIQRKYKKQAG